MQQDLYLIGGIMLRAQDIYLNLYHIDITTKITLSSLALTIKNKHFDDDIQRPIAIPHRTADEFLRRGWWAFLC